MIPDWITAIFTAILAILTILIALYAKKAHVDNKKTSYGITISNSRPPYIATLRMAFADLYKALLLKESDRIVNAIPFVKYHFNQYEGVGIDTVFIENCLDKLLDKALRKQEITHDEISIYRRWSAAILQYEWKCFKDEINKGNKLTEDEKKKNKYEIIDSVLVGV